MRTDDVDDQLRDDFLLRRQPDEDEEEDDEDNPQKSDQDDDEEEDGYSLKPLTWPRGAGFEMRGADGAAPPVRSESIAQRELEDARTAIAEEAASGRKRLVELRRSDVVEEP